jgi:EpsI family protein
MIMKKWPFLIAVLLLMGTFGLIQSFSKNERLMNNKAFEQFPLNLAEEWKGRELGLDEKVLDVLNLSDYMMRVYVPVVAQGGEESELSEGEDQKTQLKSVEAHLPVWLYVGFYQSQRTGATYHSPKNCLPGAGWQFMESDLITLTMSDQAKITVNKVLIRKGLDKQVILYWYHDRGRVIASEYWAKGYLVWDAMTKNRTDGSLVRISIPVKDGNVQEAFDHGVGFLHDLWPTLLEYMPDHFVV